MIKNILLLLIIISVTFSSLRYLPINSVVHAAETLKVMPLGDSITDGYNIPGGYRIALEDKNLNLDFVGSQQNGPSELSDKDHEGHPGWRIDEVQTEVNNWLSTHNPEVVLLMIGTNDLLGNHAPDQAPQRLSNLIDQITLVKPQAKLIVANLPPMTGWLGNDEANTRVTVFNAALPNLIQSKQQSGKYVYLADMHSQITFSDLEDGVHPNQAGYAKMANVWATAIQQVLSTSPTPTPTNTPAPTPTPVTIPEGYFKGEYFTNMTLSGQPTLVRADQNIDFDWVAGSPHDTIPNNFFSARWTKTQHFEAGTYRFTMSGDDGVRLYIDNQPVMNEWKDQGPTEYTHTLSLNAGNHDLKFEYYEKGGGAVAQLYWENIAAPTPTATPTTTPIPTTQFNAEYFNNISLSGVATLVRGENVIDHDWGAGSPHPSLPNDNFSARWTKTENLPAGNYQITVTADDGIRVYINNELILNEWNDQAPTTFIVHKNLTSGNHTIIIEYYEKGGGATTTFGMVKLPTPTPTVTPPPTPTSTPIPTGQFTAEYFSNIHLSGNPTLSRGETSVNYDWVSGSPHASIPVDYFSARWTKAQHFEAGLYQFSVTADDGVRLKVDGITVINQWKDQAPSTYTHTLSLQEGTHTIVMEYYEKAAGAVAKLDWIKLSQATPTPQPTPTPTATPLPDTEGFSAYYYNNTQLEGTPVLQRNESSIDYNWGTGSPDSSVTTDNFSAKWVTLRTFESGTYMFTVTGDDGMLLEIDGSVVLDAWKDQAPTTYSIPVILTAGEHVISFKYYEKGGGATAQMSWLQQASVDNSTQYVATYFNNTSLSGSPVLTREESVINNDWGVNSPDPVVMSDNFSARWTKQFEVLETETYQLMTTADDGVRVWIDNELVLNKWQDQPPTTYVENLILNPGTHTVVIEYYEKGAGATAKFSIEKK